MRRLGIVLAVVALAAPAVANASVNPQIAGLQVDASSGDTALDRAAWGSITESNPFPPLPKEFTSRCASPASDTNCNFGLRFFYFYNMEVSDLK